MMNVLRLDVSTVYIQVTQKKCLNTCAFAHSEASKLCRLTATTNTHELCSVAHWLTAK